MPLAIVQQVMAQLWQAPITAVVFTNQFVEDKQMVEVR
jgi:hypothetical protein